MASEVFLTSPTGGLKALPHNPNYTLADYVRFVGWSDLSGQWHKQNPNNGTETVNPSTYRPASNERFVLTHATKGGLRPKGTHRRS